MYVDDFEFDGKRLSDFGYTCITWDGGTNASSAVANIDFTTHRPVNRDVWHHYSSQFAEPLAEPIQIGKLDCSTSTLTALAPYDLSPIMRWLVRRDGFKPFKLPDQDGYSDLVFFAQIDAKPLVFGGKVYALELTVNTNRPYAVRLMSKDFTIPSAGGSYTIENISDDVGILPVFMRIATAQPGILTVKNERFSESHALEIKNCATNEVFTLDGENLIASEAVHRTDIPFAKRFNFRFPMLTSTYEDTQNKFVFSLPCSVHMEWKSPVKVGF